MYEMPKLSAITRPLQMISVITGRMVQTDGEMDFLIRKQSVVNT